MPHHCQPALLSLAYTPICPIHLDSIAEFTGDNEMNIIHRMD